MDFPKKQFILINYLSNTYAPFGALLQTEIRCTDLCTFYL